MDKIIKILKYIANPIGFFAAFLFPLRLKNGVSLFYSLVYSNYYSRFFKQCGSNFFIRAPLYLIGPKHISIGDNFYSGYRLRLEAINYNDDKKYSPILSIGNNVGFNFDCHIGCANKILIGNNVLFASRIFITDHSHGNIDSVALATAPNCRPIYSKGPVIIEDNVWIGEGVTILPNVTIGKNSIIGANSVVTINVPENSVVAGVPAQIVRILTQT